MNTATPLPALSAVAACAGAVAAFAVLLCNPAQAQPVRKCALNGRAVFQSSPCAVEPRVAAVAPHAAATDTPVAPKKKTLADLLRERDGSDPGRAQTHEFQSDGANVLRARMGAV